MQEGEKRIIGYFGLGVLVILGRASIKLVWGV